MNNQTILNSIKTNNLSHSNYLLFGEEHFFIDKIESFFLKYIIPDSDKNFNQKVFYGNETNVFSLMSVLKSFPMMGSSQLIILKDAEKMDKINELENYFLNPVKTSIFILCYKKKNIDKRKKWVKLFQKSGLLFESKKIYGYQISKFIQSNLLERNIKIEKSAEALLIDHLGTDLSKIMNAINKLSKIVLGRTINIVDIQNHIGVHREYNNFELQNALAEKDKKKIFSIVNHFSSDPNKFPFPPIIGLLFSFFSKLLIMHSLDNHSEKYLAQQLSVHPFFISVYKMGYSNYTFEDCLSIINLLKEYDLRFKGILLGESNDLLKDLILNIIYK